jgi:hypothetical protein
MHHTRTPQGDPNESLRHARTVANLERAYAAAAAAGSRAHSGSSGGGGGGGGSSGKPPKAILRIRNYQPVLLAMALTGRREAALAVERELADMKKEILDFSGESVDLCTSECD